MVRDIMEYLGAIAGWSLFIALLTLAIHETHVYAQPDTWILRTVITATDQEQQEGYFHLGDNKTEVMLIVPPNSDVHDWLKSRLGRRYTISFRAEE